MKRYQRKPNIFNHWLASVTILISLVSSPAWAQLDPVDGAASISLGFDHACLINASGGVLCWGANGSGQLGDGAFGANRLSPRPVLGLDSGVVELALGASFSCARRSDNRVFCWGEGARGQIGDNQLLSRAVPVEVTALGLSTLQLAAGEDHACAIQSGGALSCWGGNNAGQIGDNSQANRGLPTPVSGLGSGVTQVAAGFRHTCAVLSGGARCWGSNASGGLGDGTETDRSVPTPVVGLGSGVAEVSAGNRWSCARTLAGAAQCWGHNRDGELGDGTFDNRSAPAAVTGLAAGVATIRSGFGATCVTLVDGGVRCWGLNAVGQMGDGTLTRRPIAVTPIGQGSGVAEVAVGGRHTCARGTDGRIDCWGFNNIGQLGDGSTSAELGPQGAAGLSGGSPDMDVGYQFSCAVTAAGGVQCWGENAISNGQIEDGLTSNRRVPTDVPGLSGIVAVDAGESHACALSASGGVFCWGLGFRGQLGDGNSQNSSTPVTPVGLSSGVAEVVTGGDYSCARLLNGGIRCFGLGFHGVIGNGGNDDQSTPVAVSGINNAVSITAGWRHVCAVLQGGEARCWGDNLADGLGGGQLGTGNRTSSNVPVAVLAPGVAFSRLSGGGNHTCGLTTAGGVKCWGDNARGQLGDGTRDPRLTPVDVAGLESGIVSISAGGLFSTAQNHSCAVDANGAVWCWGANAFGQLGDGSTIERPQPTATGLSSGIIEVSAGGDHSCARSAAGAVLCWGLDQYGQVGAGSRDPTRAAEVVIDTLQPARTVGGGNSASGAVASDASGRFLVFESTANGLVAGDNNGSKDIFRRDLQSGQVARVSVDDAEGEVAGASMEPSVSADGQLVVLVSPDAGVGALLGEPKSAGDQRRKGAGFGIYLRNIQTGTTQRVGNAMPSGVGSKPRIAPGGGAVVFTAMPTPQQGDASKPAVFHLPLLPQGGERVPASSGAACLSCKSIAVAGVDTTENTTGTAGEAVVSADGQWVAFQTTSKNLLAGAISPCPTQASEVILRNAQTGVVQRITPAQGTLACGVGGATKPSIDYSGMQIAFQSDAGLEAGDANMAPDIYLQSVGAALNRISRDLDSRADPNGMSVEPQVSGDGQSVVFRSTARNLEVKLADNNETDDIVAVRLDRPGSRLISRNRRGDQGNGASLAPAVNYNATQVAFESMSANLTLDSATGQPLGQNGLGEVFAIASPLLRGVIFRNGLE